MPSSTAETHLRRGREETDSEKAITEFMNAIDEVVDSLKVACSEAAANTPAARTEQVLLRALRAA